MAVIPTMLDIYKEKRAHLVLRIESLLIFVRGVLPGKRNARKYEDEGNAVRAPQ